MSYSSLEIRKGILSHVFKAKNLIRLVNAQSDPNFYFRFLNSSGIMGWFMQTEKTLI